MTIGRWVLERLETGQTREQVWRAAQARFPFHKVSWGYVSKLWRGGSRRSYMEDVVS